MKKSLQLGFTIIEITITITIFLLTVAILTNYISGSYKTMAFIDEFNDAVESAKKGIEIMNQELREGSNSETGSYVIDTWDDDELIFYSDLDTDDATEKIRYYLDGANLKKDVTESPYTGAATTTILSQYVQNSAAPIFIYYTENYDIAMERHEIRRISTYLEINVTPERAPNNYEIKTQVHLRNLKKSY